METSRRPQNESRLLGERSQEIGKVVDFLAQLSEQINIGPECIVGSLACRCGRQRIPCNCRRGAAAFGKNRRCADPNRCGDQIDAIGHARGDRFDGALDKQRSRWRLHAEIAGASLNVIQAVMVSLANMVASIARSTVTQTARAQDVVASMGAVREITHQTASSIGKVKLEVVEIVSATRTRL